MTTIDQVTCSKCGAVFHVSEPERRLGSFATYNFWRECPDCKHRNDPPEHERVVIIQNTVRYKDERPGRPTHHPSGFVESAIAKALKRRTDEMFRDALRNRFRGR